MKTKITPIISFLCLFTSIALFFISCSTTGNLSSQNPRYHLMLVKTGEHPATTAPKRDDSKTAIAPMPENSPVLAYTSNAQATTLLKSETKQTKKSSPSETKLIKRLKINSNSAQWTFKGSKSIINNKTLINMTNEGPGTHSYFGLFLLFLILALVFSVLALVAPFIYIFAVISWIAAIIFFILWIVNLG